MSEKFRSRYADVNGIRMHYVSVGQGKLMLFVHGFPEYWAEWENQLVEFGKDHQAVAPDMRGYNLSSKPEDLEAYHVTDLIEDLADHGLREVAPGHPGLVGDQHRQPPRLVDGTDVCPQAVRYLHSCGIVRAGIDALARRHPKKSSVQVDIVEV